MNLKFKIAANTAFQLIGKLASSLITLIIALLLARTYGPQGFGDFTKIMTFVTLFYLASDFGFNTIVLEKLQDSSTKNSYFKNLLGLRLIWSLVLVFLSLALLSLLPQSSQQQEGFNTITRIGVIIASLSIISQSLITTANSIFQNKMRYDLSTLALLVGSIINLLLIVIIVENKLNILYIVVVYLLTGFLTALISLYLAHKVDKEISMVPAFNPEKLKEIFKKSLPLGITLAFNLIYFRADTFILTFFRTTNEVGYYGFAYRFFEGALVFPTFFLNALYPILLQKKKESYLALKKTAAETSKYLLAISFFPTVVLFVFAPQIISLTGGPAFSPSIPALRLLSISIPVFFLSALYMWILITIEKRSALALVYGLSMILNIVLNLILIPSFGIIAAAITTGIGELTILLFTYSMCRNFFKNEQ